MDTQDNSPIIKAAEILGGIAKLASICKITPQAAHKWVNTQVPANRCIQIEQATNGAVTRYELRPDVFGSPDSPDQPVNKHHRTHVRRAADREDRRNREADK